MKIGVSLPDDLITFADDAVRRPGTSRSELLARLLEAERGPRKDPVVACERVDVMS